MIEKETNKYLSKLYKPNKPYYKMNIEELKSHILICKSLDRMSYSKIKRIEKFSPEKLQKKINNYLERQKQKRLRKNKTKKKNFSLDNDNTQENNSSENSNSLEHDTKLIKKKFRKSKKISDLGKMIKRTIKKKVIKLKNNTTLKSKEID